MSHREVVFRRLLGHEPDATEQADMGIFHEVMQLRDNDPFWGIAAFLYTRVPSDAENRERLKLTQASLETFSQKLEAALARHESRAADRDSALQDALMVTIEAAITAATVDPAPRPSIREWFGAHVNAVLATTGVLVLAGVLAVILAYWTGETAVRRIDALRAVAQAAQAHTRAAWIQTRDGREVYAWARLNATGLHALLTCSYPGWRRARQEGYVVCYPEGGYGYYLAH